MIEIANGGVATAKEFFASGVHAGVKSAKIDKKDIALIYTPLQAFAAGVFTQNLYAAAPVCYDRKIVASGLAKAIVTNSGNANAGTGAQGLDNAQKMAGITAQLLQIKPEEVLVCSTGVIGVQLPMDVVDKGIRDAASRISAGGGHDAALAIMTTDTFAKEVAVVIELNGKKVTVGGMAKGSGMIHPNMATLLGYLTTDAAIGPQALQKVLKSAADQSFNMVSVDGDTSTNDTLLILANGAAENKTIEEGTAEYKIFAEAVNYVCLKLAKMIAADGEGATHLIEVQVKNACSQEDAVKAAKAVVSSSLVKAAFFGQDANWGRIICAVGYSGAKLDVNKVDITLQSASGSEPVMRSGVGLQFDEENAAGVLRAKEIQVLIDLHDGEFSATAWGCDLTYDYVKINGDYRT